MKKLSKRTKFVLLAVANLTWYTLVVLYANFHDHMVAPELTMGWFAAWTIELALLYGLKVKSKDQL